MVSNVSGYKESCRSCQAIVRPYRYLQFERALIERRKLSSHSETASRIPVTCLSESVFEIKLAAFGILSSNKHALFIQVSLHKPDALVAKNPPGLSRIRVKKGYFSRISRIRRPKIVRVIEGPTYRGTPVLTMYMGWSDG